MVVDVDIPIDVEVVTVSDLPPLTLTPPPEAAEAPPAGPAPDDGLITEAEVRQALVWVTDRLAEITGEPKDRAAEWELQLTAPGVARMLNEWFPSVAAAIKQWSPAEWPQKLPPWTGLLLMIVRRVAPRVAEGVVIEWIDRVFGWIDRAWSGTSSSGSETAFGTT